jgi:DNA-directed RNA polymerase specialized sigma24 family protein
MRMPAKPRVIDVTDPYSAALVAVSGLVCSAEDRNDVLQEAACEVVRATAYFAAHNNDTVGTGLAGYQAVAARRAAYRWLSWRRRATSSEVCLSEYSIPVTDGATDAVEQSCMVGTIVAEVASVAGARYAQILRMVLDKDDAMYAAVHMGRRTIGGIADALGVHPSSVHRAVDMLAKYLEARADVYNR